MSNFQDLEYTVWLMIDIHTYILFLIFFNIPFLKLGVSVIKLIGMERMIKHVAEHIQLDRQKWKHGIEVSSWPTKHMITKRAQTDG